MQQQSLFDSYTAPEQLLDAVILETNQRNSRINDFGAKLGGARKDAFASKQANAATKANLTSTQTAKPNSSTLKQTAIETDLNAQDSSVLNQAQTRDLAAEFMARQRLTAEEYLNRQESLLGEFWSFTEILDIKDDRRAAFMHSVRNVITRSELLNPSARNHRKTLIEDIKALPVTEADLYHPEQYCTKLLERINQTNLYAQPYDPNVTPVYANFSVHAVAHEITTTADLLLNNIERHNWQHVSGATPEYIEIEGIKHQFLHDSPQVKLDTEQRFASLAKQAAEQNLSAEDYELQKDGLSSELYFQQEQTSREFSQELIANRLTELAKQKEFEQQPEQIAQRQQEHLAMQQRIVATYWPMEQIDAIEDQSKAAYAYAARTLISRVFNENANYDDYLKTRAIWYLKTTDLQRNFLFPKNNRLSVLELDNLAEFTPDLSSFLSDTLTFGAVLENIERQDWPEIDLITNHHFELGGKKHEFPSDLDNSINKNNDFSTSNEANLADEVTQTATIAANANIHLSSNLNSNSNIQIKLPELEAEDLPRYIADKHQKIRAFKEAFAKHLAQKQPNQEISHQQSNQNNQATAHPKISSKELHKLINDNWPAPKMHQLDEHEQLFLDTYGRVNIHGDDASIYAARNLAIHIIKEHNLSAHQAEQLLQTLQEIDVHNSFIKDGSVVTQESKKQLQGLVPDVDTFVADVQEFTDCLRGIHPENWHYLDAIQAEYLQLSGKKFYFETHREPPTHFAFDVRLANRAGFIQDALEQHIFDKQHNISAKDKKLQFVAEAVLFNADDTLSSAIIYELNDKLKTPLIEFKAANSQQLARNFLAAPENQAELIKLHKIASTANKITNADIRAADNRERQSKDYRNGRNIPEAIFQKTFGFKAGEFGNWVTQKERQELLNNTYDALMDLASALEISPKALSLDGNLAISFGARGTGGINAAAAHFESNKVVINLTKKQGAGCLAHEWFHALDNHLAKQAAHLKEPKDIFLTDLATNANKSARQADNSQAEQVTLQSDLAASNHQAQHSNLKQMAANSADSNQLDKVQTAVANLVEKLEQSQMYKRAQNLDANAKQPYWSDKREMAARAFENYVIATLANKDRHNDFLANVRDEQHFGKSADKYPYLTAAELPAIKQAFNQVFTNLQNHHLDNSAAINFTANALKINASTDAQAVGTAAAVSNSSATMITADKLVTNSANSLFSLENSPYQQLLTNNVLAKLDTLHEQIKAKALDKTADVQANISPVNAWQDSKVKTNISPVSTLKSDVVQADNSQAQQANLQPDLAANSNYQTQSPQNNNLSAKAEHPTSPQDNAVIAAELLTDAKQTLIQVKAQELAEQLEQQADSAANKIAADLPSNHAHKNADLAADKFIPQAQTAEQPQTARYSRRR